MAINIAPKSLDTELSKLMRDVSTGKEQLPEFQRSWTWDDERIRGIMFFVRWGFTISQFQKQRFIELMLTEYQLRCR